MTAISITNLSFSFGMHTVLDKVSFSLEENDRLGIVGVNGCGKSTLFKLILGEHEPDTGSIYISKDKSVGILTQDGAFTDEGSATPLAHMYAAFPHLLEAEARLARLEELLKEEGDHTAIAGEYSELYARYRTEGGLEFRGRAAAILMKMGYREEDMHRPIATLSGGQRTRLALSRQLCREPNILLLDEPTNHLDIETLAWLESFLASYKKCVIVISHDRYFLDRVTNKTLFLEHTHAKLYDGAYSKSLAAREEDRKIAQKHYEIQQREIARQEAYIAQQRAWNRERNIIAAESRQKMLDKMEKLERPKDDPKAIRMRFHMAIESGNEVLRAKELAMAFPGHPLFDSLSFLVKKRERVFIAGPNGSGKSTLIKLILGKLRPTGGQIEFGYNVEIGYYDQENQNLDPDSTVLDELWNRYPSMNEVDIRNTLALFRFVGEDVFKKVSMLSGGERARLTFSKLMLSKINLLVLDDPTNHLDIDSREALENALDLFEGTIIAVSHDRYFIDKLATRILSLSDRGHSGSILDYPVSHIGEGYREFAAYKATRAAESGTAVAGTSPASGKDQYLQNKKLAAEARKEQNRLKRLREEAATLEAELEKVEEELYGSAATDYVRAAELETRRVEIEERLLEIYEETEE